VKAILFDIGGVILEEEKFYSAYLLVPRSRSRTPL